MNIVVVAPHGVLDLSGLGPLPDTAEVCVVGWADAARTDAPTVAVERPDGVQGRARGSVVRRASGSVVGRTLLRLSTWDEGVWFWRAATAAADVRSAVGRADLLVAAERDGVYCAWRWARSARRADRCVAAVLGFPAGRAFVQGESS